MSGLVRSRARSLVLTAVFAAVLPTLQPLVATRSAAAAGTARRPNVLVIVTDDQRASRDSYKVMPALKNRVRDRGLWFRNAIATHPLCCPSRVSIFTGQYAHNHGTIQNGGAGWTANEQKRSIQYTLGQAGYSTAVIGKFINAWHTDPPYFDRWAIMRRYGYERSTFDIQGRLVDVDQYSTSFMADKAVDYIERFERRDTTPWLMFVEPWAPHKPSTPAKKYATAKVPAFKPNPATEEANRRDKPAYVQKKQANKEKTLNLRGNMLRTLYSVNDMVKQLMRKLRRLDERNTIIFYLSDNGFQWYEHKLEAKRYPYEASVRIPMFVRWPGHLASGERRYNIVGNIDVAPTIYDLTGIKPAYTVDGRSMMTSDRRNLLIEYWHERHEGSPPTYKALWNPKWTYVEYQDVSSKDRLEYYGPDDPWQLHNLFGNSKKGDEPSNRRRLARRLDRLANCAGDSC